MAVSAARTVRYAAAAAASLAEAMQADARVVALGEDLGRGGIFGQYQGLIERFGADRVIDTPISEATIVGAAVGMALTGLKPVVEMRVVDFAPGLVVMVPATPQDNHALLRAAIDGDDPVAYLEHKELWALEGEVDPALALPPGRARITRPGSDLTIVSWSKCVHWSLEAAELLAAEGMQAEVIDLRTLWPWDRETVLASAARTGRVLVAHEAVQVAGFGAEIAGKSAAPFKPTGDTPWIAAPYSRPASPPARWPHRSSSAAARSRKASTRPSTACPPSSAPRFRGARAPRSGSTW